MDQKTMWAPRFRSLGLLLAATCVGLALESRGAAKPPQIPKVSSFAPASDLIVQVDYFLARLEPSLVNETTYDLAAQSRAWKDANTLSALLLMLALHDEKHPLSGHASAMLAAAQRLAVSSEQFPAAREAFDALRLARAGRSAAVPPPAWGRVAALGALMKQVPLVHMALKRGVEPNRLARQKAQSAAQSAALAAVAQASWLDTTHLTRPDDVEPWRQCCEEMRDAAGGVNAALHSGDAPQLEEGLRRLSESCDHCHARFRNR